VPDAGSLGQFPADTAAALNALRLPLVARRRAVGAVNAPADDYGVALLDDGEPVVLRVIPVAARREAHGHSSWAKTLPTTSISLRTIGRSVPLMTACWASCFT
jgi:hypothetical protein